MTSEQNLPLAITFLMAQIVISIAIGAFVKSISAETALIVILCFRYIFSIPLLLVYGYIQRGRALFQVTQKSVLVARIIAGLMGLASYLYAVIQLSISLATVLAQTMSLFITMMAPLILAERIGIRRVAGISTGFIGVLIVLNPGSEIFSSYSVEGLIAGMLSPFCGALMYIFLRKLGASDAPISTAIWYNLAGSVLFLLLMVFLDLSVPVFSADTYGLWSILIGIGLASSLQQFLMARSHQLAEASTLAPFHYASAPLSIFVGIAAFNDHISLNFILGTLVIIGASWYILRREQHLKRIGRL